MLFLSVKTVEVEGFAFRSAATGTGFPWDLSSPDSQAPAFTDESSCGGGPAFTDESPCGGGTSDGRASTTGSFDILPRSGSKSKT